ncbi:MAG TPA: TolC family protein [Blastocatellia bacterium]|nr:TolC family protein [Blastocatellia bacterium]
MLPQLKRNFRISFVLLCALLFASPDFSFGQSPAHSAYLDPLQGTSSSELVARSLASNIELAAARLEIKKAQGRLRQAGLRANPTVDFEHTTGHLTGTPGEDETSVGFSLPLELNGQRQRRVDLARAELEAVEAEIADRERRLSAEIRAAYAEALAAVRELEITEGLSNLDTQTARIVEARVSEGESAPIELNLLRAEVDRLRSRRALVEGRLQSALLRLKSLAGVSPDEPLRLKEDLVAPTFSKPPASLEEAINTAMRMRPDLRLARLLEKVAEAGYELALAQARPDISAFTRYSRSRSLFDNTPVGAIRDKDNTLSFGVSLSIPLFNRNQGSKTEAAAAIAQAQRRREFAEQVIRADVASAFARYVAAQSAVAIFEQGVLARSTQNVKSIRGAYELGAFRMTELLAEQRRLMDSEREYTEALTERYKALADLNSAMGVSGNDRNEMKRE